MVPELQSLSPGGAGGTRGEHNDGGGAGRGRGGPREEAQGKLQTSSLFPKDVLRHAYQTSLDVQVVRVHFILLLYRQSRRSATKPRGRLRIFIDFGG